MIVVDASLAAKWVLWEEDSRRALQFLVKYGDALCAPDIVFVEVGQAVIRRANEDKTIAEDALEALRKWTTRWGGHVLRPHRVTQRRLWEAGRLAVELGHPLKDCIYLRLAMELSCELATCDAKFRRRAVKSYPDIRLLSDCDLSDVKAFG